jgi:hypothetical protein
MNICQEMLEVLEKPFHGGLDDRDVPRQSRIELFEVHKHLEQTIPEASVQGGEHPLLRYGEI